MKFTKISTVLTLGAASFGLLFLWNIINTAPARAKVRPAPRGQDARNIAALHRAGLKGDRSQVPQLIAALKDATHLDYRYAALHALAQMGARDALPQFEALRPKSIMLQSADPDLSNYAEAARARLLAESSTQAISNPNQRAQSKLHKFLVESGLDIPGLNTALTAQERLRADREGTLPMRIYALRELADMIYQDRDQALAKEVQAQGIRFDQDAPSALKVDLASLPTQERVNRIVEYLAHLRVLTSGEYYPMQLAINEGTFASRAAAAKLEEMRGKRDQYPSDIGFAALFRLIRGGGDKEQAPIVAQFLNDSDSGVAYYADQSLPYIQGGIPYTYRPGY
ncbi:MAG: hypothetical protein M3Y28_00245 [Armatimonadota bacterium]|nr:hypothetical protein [Armatimonadota bacterium]